jgi:hypothetical protein
MRQDHFKRQLGISIAVIVGTVVIATVALYFLTENIEETARAIGMARAQTASENAELQDLASLEQNAGSAASYQAAMDKLLASQAALITFPAQVESLSRAHAVSTSFSFDGSPLPPATSTPGSITFSLNVSGPIAGVISFMKDFESAAPVLLSSLDAANVTGSGSSYTLTVRGTVYFK